MLLISVKVPLYCHSVAATCSVQMAESVRRTHPEPEAEPGAGTSVSCSNSSESNPNMLLKAQLPYKHLSRLVFEHNISKRNSKYVRQIIASELKNSRIAQ